MTPPHTLQEVEDLILKELEDVFTTNRNAHIGAPENEGSLNIISKKAHRELTDFLRTQIHKIAAQTLSAVTPEEIEHDSWCGYEHCVGCDRKKARQEVLRRGKEFLQVPPNAKIDQ